MLKGSVRSQKIIETTDPASGGRRGRKEARTLAAIADTAPSLFRKHGFEDVTMEQIAAASDVSTPVLRLNQSPTFTLRTRVQRLFRR